MKNKKLEVDPYKKEKDAMRPFYKPVNIEVGDTVKMRHSLKDKGLPDYDRRPHKVAAVINSPFIQVPIVLLENKEKSYTPVWLVVIKKHKKQKVGNGVLLKPKRIPTKNVFKGFNGEIKPKGTMPKVVLFKSK